MHHDEDQGNSTHECEMSTPPRPHNDTYRINWFILIKWKKKKKRSVPKIPVLSTNG